MSQKKESCIIIPGGLKRCTKCGKNKPFSEFRMRDAKRNAVYSHCNDCHREYSRDWSHRVQGTVPRKQPAFGKYSPELGVEIGLSAGLVTLVDEEDYDSINQFKWHINGSGYAARNEYDDHGKPVKHVQMHRQLLGAKEDTQVDHINGDRLDNRRCNLRIATDHQNRVNKKRYSSNKSGYKGVTKRRGMFCARITVNGVRRHLGEFSDPIDAARAYDLAAIQNFGEFARLNGVV
jgi:hypothetical protein